MPRRQRALQVVCLSFFGPEWMKQKMQWIWCSHTFKKIHSFEMFVDCWCWKCCNTSLDVAIAIEDHWNVPIPPLEGSGVQEQLETNAWHYRCLGRWKPNLSHTCHHSNKWTWAHALNIWRSWRPYNFVNASGHHIYIHGGKFIRSA